MRKLLLLLLLVVPGQAVTVGVPLSSGWNAVGLQGAPVSLLNAPSAVSGLAWYDGQGYQTASVTVGEVNTRRAFWVFATSATTLSYTASDVQASSLTLREGWNMATFPAVRAVPGANLQCRIPGEGGPVPLTSALLANFAEIQADGGTVFVDVTAGGQLTPGRVYWVYARIPVTISYGV